MADTVDPETGEILEALEPDDLDEPDMFMARGAHEIPRSDSGAIAAAIAQVMGEVGGVKKTGYNKFHQYSYATIADLMSSLQQALARAGLAIIQSEEKVSFLAEGKIVSVTYSFTLLHSSGAVSVPFYQSGWSPLFTPGKFAALDDKALNKCHTSARKYAYKALFCVPDVEDAKEKSAVDDADGQEMTQAVQRRPAPTPPAPPRAEPVPGSWAEGGRDPQPGRLTMIKNGLGEPLVGRWLKAAIAKLTELPAQERTAWLELHKDIVDECVRLRPGDVEMWRQDVAALDSQKRETA